MYTYGGDWNDPAIWVDHNDEPLNRVPTADDDVFILGSVTGFGVARNVTAGLLAGLDEACCCDPFEYTIEICNSNSITDDDWRVELNGKNIGTHSAPQNILAGTAWRTEKTIEVGCGTVTYKTLQKSDFVAGNNSLVMTITALYFAANYGTVHVKKWKWDKEQNTFVLDSVLLAGEYTGPSTIGVVNTFQFNFP